MMLNRRNFLRGTAALGGMPLLLPSLTAGAAAAEQLVLYNGQHRKTTEALVTAFTKATGIAVKVRHAESPELASQIMEEGDRSPADLFFSEQSPPIAALDEKGLLVPVAAPVLQSVPSTFAAKDGTWLGATVRTRVVTYNKDMVKLADLPKSIMDFGTAALGGKFGYVKQDGFQEQVMAIAHIKGRQAALDWLKGLKKYGRAYNGNRIASTAVENGEVAMALSNNYYWYSLAREKGAETLHTALHSFPSGDPGNLYCVAAAGILKASRRQEAAQKFIAFMVSKPGQEAMVATTAEYPVLAGVTSPFALPPLSGFDAPVTPADVGSASQAYALEREAGLI
jgi:iron(III) transport system substrate-binding protein